MKARIRKKIGSHQYDSRGRFVFVSDKTGKRRVCRVDNADWSDPIMIESGCAGDFRDDFVRMDRREGCAKCLYLEDSL